MNTLTTLIGAKDLRRPLVNYSLPLAAGFLLAYFIAGMTTVWGWGFIFGALGLLFVVGFSIRRSIIAVLMVVIVFVVNASVMGLTEERWAVLAAGIIPLLWRLAMGMRIRFTMTNFHVIYVFFMCWIFISTLYSEIPLLTFAKSVSVLLVFLCYFIVLFYHLKARPTDFRLVLNVMLYLNAVVIVFSILRDPMVLLNLKLSGRSVLGNPNSLGAFLALSVAYVIYQYYGSKSRIVAWLWMALLWINVMLVLGSWSRAGLLGAFVSICMYWFARNRAGFYYFGGLLTCLILAAMAMSPGIRDRVINTYIFKGSAEVLRSREALWERQWDVFKRYPFTGVGFGVSEGRASVWKVGLSSSGGMQEPGSSLFMLMEGTGLPGMVLGYGCVLLLLWHGFLRYIQLLRTPRWTEEQHVLAVVLAGLTGGFVNCQFEGWLYAMGGLWPHLFWLQATMLLYIIVRMEEKEMGMLDEEKAASILLEKAQPAPSQP